MNVFRGLLALVLEKRQALWQLPLWLALPAGLLVGFLARVKHAEPTDLVFIVFVATLLTALFAPILAASFVTLAVQQTGARARRDELLALPIGRLAIPTSTLLVSATLAVGTIAAFLFGFSFFLGRERVLGALLSPALGTDMPFSLLVRTGTAFAIFAFIWAFATISHGPNLSLLLLATVGTILGIVPVLSGYAPSALFGYQKLWIGCLVAYALVLPFLLYARPPHHWAIKHTPGKLNTAPGGPAVTALGASFLTLTTLGCLGAGKALALLCLGALAIWRKNRKLPPVERRHVSNIAVAHVVGLVFVAPPVLLGLGVDARRFAEAALPTPEALQTYAVSSDGRHVAACLRLDGLRGLSRVVVADVSGQEPLRVLPPRFAQLEESCAWSKDGRYLAVHELAIGRVTVPVAFNWGLPITYGAEVNGLDSFFGRNAEILARCLQGTYVLDTQTGALAEKSLLELAPGWVTPDELLHVSPHSLGGCDLADGRRHSALWDKPELKVDDYSSEGVVVVSGNERFLLGASGLAPVASGWRWELATTKKYSDGVDPATSPTRWDLTFARGEKTRTVVGCRSPHAIWVDDTSVVVSDGSGSSLLELESGESHALTRQDRKERLVAEGRLWSSPGDRLRFAEPCQVVSTPEGDSFVDLRTRAVAPLPRFPGFVPELVVVGKRVFGRTEGKVLSFCDGAAAPRPVF